MSTRDPDRVAHTAALPPTLGSECLLGRDLAEALRGGGKGPPYTHAGRIYWPGMLSRASRVLVLLTTVAVAASPATSLLCDLRCDTRAPAKRGTTSDVSCHQHGKNGAPLLTGHTHRCAHPQLSPSAPTNNGAVRALVLAIATSLVAQMASDLAVTRPHAVSPPGPITSPPTARPSVLRI
jgi:hypothetical protein